MGNSRSVGKAAVQICLSSIGLLFCSTSSLHITMKVICFVLLVGIGVAAALKCKQGGESAEKTECPSVGGPFKCGSGTVAGIKVYTCVPEKACGTKIPDGKGGKYEVTCSSSVIQRLSILAFLPIVATILFNWQ